MPTSSGLNFGRGFWGGGACNPGKKKAKKFAIKFAEKFAGNFPKIRLTKLKDSPQIRSAGPRDQLLFL